MGLAVDTHSTFKYVLEDKRLLPEAEQPYLVFRFVSARDCAKMERLFSEAYVDSDSTVLEKCLEGIKIGLVGWHGYEVAFDLNEVDAVLSRVDLVELRNNLVSSMSISQYEKKVFASRSLSTSAKSVSETQPVSA